MDKLKKNIIILIIGIIVLIIIILFMLLNFNKSSNNNVLENDDKGDEGQSIPITNKEEKITDFSDFKNVETCIQKYYNILNDESIDFYQRDENGEYVRIDEKSIYKMRLDLLSDEFVNNYNITIENIYNYLKPVNEQCNVKILKMKKVIHDNIDKYAAQVICINSNFELLNEFYIIVNVDSNNKTFSIEPILVNYNSIDDIEITNKSNGHIEANDYNTYKWNVYNNESIAENYFILYKTLALSKPNFLYNNCMSDEYKKKRFDDEKSFEKYIEDNKKEIQGLKFDKYLTNVFDDYTEYVCQDQYGRNYVFKAINVTDYTVQLDTYTIPTEKFNETYTNAEDKKKVQMNVDKFIQMINRHDYKTSYNCISEGFKNNYFDTQDKFENYIRNTFFEYNNFTFKNIEQKGNNLYTCTFEVTDYIQESNETRTVTVIMRLNDDTDFEMSFQT